MRFALAVVVLVGLACSSAAPRGGGGDPAPIDAAVVQPPAPDAAPPPSPAEQALAQHGERLRDAPGVISVEIAAPGDRLAVEVCAPEASARVDTTGVGVPVEFAVGTTTRVTARGESCGCTYHDAYYAPGESYHDGCNTCACDGEGRTRCTLMYCKIGIYEQVFFAKNSTKLSPEAQALIAEIVRALADYPELRLKVIGHAAAGEKKPAALGLTRAEAVVAALVAAGVDPARLSSESRGDAAPIDTKKRARNRRVEFEVIQPD